MLATAGRLITVSRTLPTTTPASCSCAGAVDAELVDGTAGASDAVDADSGRSITRQPLSEVRVPVDRLHALSGASQDIRRPHGSHQLTLRRRSTQPGPVALESIAFPPRNLSGNLHR